MQGEMQFTDSGENRTVVAGVSFTWDRTKLESMHDKFLAGIVDMAMDIRNKAINRAPYVTGALRNSIRTENMSEDGIDIIAGGISSPIFAMNKSFKGNRFVNYADIRERGPNRNPATEHYMQRSLEEVMAGDWQQRYFKGVI